MNSRQLTTRQAEQLLEKIRPTTGYLRQLQARMIERGFPSNDPLLLVVNKAYDAMDHLFMELHYLSGGRGAGGPRTESRSDGSHCDRRTPIGRLKFFTLPPSFCNLRRHLTRAAASAYGVAKKPSGGSLFC